MIDLINILDVTCGAAGNTLSMDPKIPDLVSKAILLIQIVVPVLLIIFGMLDLGKAVMAQKEDEIKKGQQTFIKRLIAAVIVFFVVVVVKLVVGLVADSSNSGAISNCLDCFLKGSKSCQAIKK